MHSELFDTSTKRTTTVDEVIERPFLKRKLEEKKKIVCRYKPRPHLRLMYQDEDGIIKKANFERKIYNNIFWLTGCEKRQKMYCWPCLLYMPPNVWNSGLEDLAFVKQNYKAHAEDLAHKDAVFQMHTFISDNFEDSDAIYSLGRGDLKITNQEHVILTSLIETVCAAVIVNISNGENHKCDMLEVNDCVHILQLQRKNVNVDAIIDLLANRPAIIKDIVDAISKALKGVIENEMEECLAASIILTEHLISKEKGQISTVLRYVKNGEVFERFVGFSNSLQRRRQVKNVTRHIERVKTKFNLQDKILVVAVDGLILQASQISKLSDGSNEAPCKYVVPSYFHEFGRVLLQSVSHFEDCGLFFKTFTAIQSFFKNQTYMEQLELQIMEKLPNLKKNRFYTSSPFIAFLAIYRRYFHAYLSYELAYSTFISGDDRAKVITFISFLDDFKTIFLLKLFAKIFADYFDKTMNFIVNMYQHDYDSELMKFRAKISKFQKSGFKKFWLDANLEKLGEKKQNARKIAEIENNPERKSYCALFEKILNQVLKEMENRRSDMLRLAFCRIFNYNCEGDHEFRKLPVSQLLYELAPHFDQDTVSSEIRVFSQEAMFKNKKIHGIMETFNEYNLKDAFSQLYKAAEFVLTLPFLPPTKDFDDKTSKIKKIEALSYVPKECGSSSGETSILRVEKRMLQDLKSSKKFIDSCIKKYCEIQINK